MPPKGKRRKFKVLATTGRRGYSVNVPMGVWCDGKRGCFGGPIVLKTLIDELATAVNMRRVSTVQDRSRYRVTGTMNFNQLDEVLQYFHPDNIQEVKHFGRLMS